MASSQARAVQLSHSPVRFLFTVLFLRKTWLRQEAEGLLLSMATQTSMVEEKGISSTLS